MTVVFRWSVLLLAAVNESLVTCQFISDFIIVASVLNFEDGAGECHIMMCHRIDRQMTLSASFTVMDRHTAHNRNNTMKESRIGHFKASLRYI